MVTRSGMRGRVVAMPSICMERNINMAWAHRFWLVEGRESFPQVFHAMRGHRRCKATNNYVAVTRMPPSVAEDTFLVVVLGHIHRGQGGRQCRDSHTLCFKCQGAPSQAIRARDDDPR